MDNVFGPCLKYAYNKLAKEKDGMSHSVRRVMFESIQPQLNDLVSEMMKMDIALLPKSEVRKFHRDSLGNCKAGVGQLRQRAALMAWPPAEREIYS